MSERESCLLHLQLTLSSFIISCIKKKKSLHQMSSVCDQDAGETFFVYVKGTMMFYKWIVTFVYSGLSLKDIPTQYISAWPPYRRIMFKYLIRRAHVYKLHFWLNCIKSTVRGELNDIYGARRKIRAVTWKTRDFYREPSLNEHFTLVRSGVLVRL